MNIYTKTGDKGETSLANGQRVRKSDSRIEAYGTADEVNSHIGWLRAALTDLSSTWQQETDMQLHYIQNRLFDLGAVLAGSDLPFPADADTKLEQWIDAMQASLPVYHAFLLPTGSEKVARCHLCRTEVRHMERAILKWGEESGVQVEETILRFVNRLSDYCFVLARKMAQEEGIKPCFWEK